MLVPLKKIQLCSNLHNSYKEKIHYTKNGFFPLRIFTSVVKITYNETKEIEKCSNTFSDAIVVAQFQ